MDDSHSQRPTLAEIRRWAATTDVTATASALGVSRAHLYEQIKLGTAPIRTIRVGGRVRVVTASILTLLGDDDQANAARETA